MHNKNDVSGFPFCFPQVFPQVFPQNFQPFPRPASAAARVSPGGAAWAAASTSMDMCGSSLAEFAELLQASIMFVEGKGPLVKAVRRDGE